MTKNAWLWTSPNGKEQIVLGIHEESPPLPDGVDDTSLVEKCVSFSHQALSVGQVGSGKTFESKKNI